MNCRKVLFAGHPGAMLPPPHMSRISITHPGVPGGLFRVLLLLLAGLAAAPAGPLPAAAVRAAPAPTGAVTNTPATKPAPGADDATLRTRLNEARVRLAAEGDSALTNAPPGVSTEEVWLRRAGLGRLVRLYEQQLDNRLALDRARQRKEAEIREAQSWTRFAEPPPYSILLVDRLREELQVELHQVETGIEAGGLLQQLIQENEAAMARAEERVRQINEQLESARDSAVTARLTWLRDLERLRSQVAAATVAVVDLERRLGEENQAASRSRIGLLRRQLVLAEAGARFTEADFNVVTHQLERHRAQLERELAGARTNQAAALRELEAVRVTAEKGELGAEMAATREVQWETADTVVATLRLMLEGVSVERTMWELRHAAHDSRDVEALRQSQRRLEVMAGRMAVWRNYARGQIQIVLDQLQMQEARRDDLPSASEIRPILGERIASLHERERTLRRFQSGIQRAERLTDHWSDGLQAATGRLPFTGRVRNLFTDMRSFGSRFWNFEVFTAEDTITVDGQQITGRRSVTIGKLLMALAILVLGYWLTGILSALIEPVVIRRFRIETNQANLIRRWVRALLVVVLVVISLVSVKIPLTIFAFAGGALAIGLGFGTQTMLKNLVSGLILLFERPFRVGDVVDVGGQRGTVSSIGLRASVLQLWDGTETLIPNSSLLEGNVTNWTYSNRKVRFTVTVGVAYNADVRRVMHLLTEVAERHGLVEKEPKPQVLFTDFGDSTLAFEMRFWLDISRASAAQVSSDLRLMIAGVLAENGIAIDYPQRDVHLFAARPIPVQVMAGGTAEAPGAAPGPPSPRAAILPP